MEGIKRKPFQGITNIVRFNWHFYGIAITIVIIVIVLIQFVPANFSAFLGAILILLVLGVSLSLAVSFYIYDCSSLYTLHWLKPLNIGPGSKLVNIHAGFDETSFLLSEKYPDADLLVLDFYDPVKHTEISIARARKAHAVYPLTKSISTSVVPLKADTIDYIFIILSAHEIRNSEERISFFKGLQGSLKDRGKIIVVEHLRDIPNFLAYNVGFLHFFSNGEWSSTFSAAGLTIGRQFKITPFLSVFILQKDGITA